MIDEQRRAFVRLWTLTVSPDVAEDSRRWKLTRPGLDAAEVERRQRHALEETDGEHHRPASKNACHGLACA